MEIKKIGFSHIQMFIFGEMVLANRCSVQNFKNFFHLDGMVRIHQVFQEARSGPDNVPSSVCVVTWLCDHLLVHISVYPLLFEYGI